MNQYELSDPARDDLDEIFAYISEDDESAALAIVIRVLDLCSRLAAHPRMGRTRDELQEGLRSIPLGTFIVFYRIWAGKVVITRVLHAARDIDEIFS